LNGARALGLCLALCGASALAQPAGPRFTVPGAISELRAHGEDVVQGVPMRMHAVLSSWQLQPLLQHFADTFLEANLYLPPVKSQPRWLREPQLTALDVNRQISYTVIFQPHKDGTTTVILGEADLARRTPADVGLPVFPGVRGAMQSRSESGRMVSYVAAATSAEVSDYYRTTLIAAGWAPADSGVFVKSGMRLEVSVSAEPQGTAVRLVELPASRGE
jgi:hypothetical protein